MSSLVFFKLLAIFVVVAIGWVVGKLRWLGDATNGSDPAARSPTPRTTSSCRRCCFAPRRGSTSRRCRGARCSRCSCRWC
jgi:hypothetical protein